MLAPLLVAVCLFAGDAATPARHPGDPPAPQLEAVPDRGPQIPAPLPQIDEAAPDGRAMQIGPRELRQLTLLPGASIASLVVVPAALGLRAGDWGTPMTELLAGWGGAYAGLSLTLGLTAAVERVGPVPDPKIGFNRGALGVALGGTLLLTPAAVGTSVWLSGEGMQGRSARPTNNLVAAMGGALAVELLFAGSAVVLRQPPGPAMSLAFIPIAAGATLAYDLSRGPHRGPRRAVMPIVAIRF